MKQSGIYFIINLINKKFYIGSSSNLEFRWYMHKWELKKNKHHSIKLQRAWNKYGEQNFKFHIVELCLTQDLIKNEQWWLDNLNSSKNGYNVLSNASSHLGRKCSEETKRKIGEANKIKSKGNSNRKGYKHTEEWKEEQRERKVGNKNLLGFKFSDESKIKMRDSHLGQIGFWNGKKRSEETKLKMSKSAKNRKKLK